MLCMVQPERWQTGDEASFEAMVRQHERLVFGTAYLMTGSKEEAEDVLQEVFASLWQARDKFDPSRAKLSTWLHRVTVNRCVDKYRKKRLAPLSLERAALESRSPGCEELPEDALDTKQRREKLIGAIDALDSKHRAVVVLRYFSEQPYSEIAEVLGIPLGTVKSRINQAVRLIRERLDVGDRREGVAGCTTAGTEIAKP